MTGSGTFIPQSIADIDKILSTTVLAVEEKKAVARKLKQARESLASERSRLAQLQAAMEREQKDVARLEGLSLAGLFYTVMGNKPAALDKEKQEFLTAKLRRDEAAASVKALEEDLEALTSRLAKMGNPEIQLERLLEKKEELVMAEGGAKARELLALDEERGRLLAERREVLEARDAGHRVESSLNEVLRSLESAQDWGMWDLLGGGLLATAAKHSNLDKARENVHRAQSDMRRFQRELGDIGSVAEGFSIGGFERFADYFFDGLFVDWMVQSKINTSVDRTREQIGRIRSLVRSLDGRAKSLEGRIEALNARRREFLSR
ncbi:MAG: hypothetical protein ACOX5M_04730 [Bacillota bacterium]|jgi:hypothetical protein